MAGQNHSSEIRRAARKAEWDHAEAHRRRSPGNTRDCRIVQALAAADGDTPMPSPANINVWLLPLSILSFHLETVDVQATFVRPGLPISVQLFRDLVLRAFLITSAPLPHLAEHEFAWGWLVADWTRIGHNVVARLALHLRSDESTGRTKAGLNGSLIQRTTTKIPREP